MSTRELLTCSKCHCLVHETRAKANVEISISVGGRLELKTERQPFCMDCFKKVTAGAYALCPQEGAQNG